MNEPSATCTIAIIVVTVLCSILGFHDRSFRERYLFAVREVLAEKQYQRMLTAAFLHADWIHLLLNMAGLYVFGAAIERLLGSGQFLLIYFTAIIGGNALALWMHRHHEYHAYGASGGVCGLMFAHVFLFPGGNLSLLMMPSMPSWLYLILFLVLTFWRMKERTDNIGHDAHLGGAIVGLFTTAALQPSIIVQSPKLFFTLSLISIALFIYLAKNPLFLALSTFTGESSTRTKKKTKHADHPTYRREPREVDVILEKISKTGVESLTAEEKAMLKSVSEKYQRRDQSEKPKSDLII